MSTSRERRLLRRMTQTQAPAATGLIRLAVGCIFLSEGIQRFLFPAELGVGRFVKIGLPAPQLLAPFVGVVEIGCGLLVLAGLATRLAAVPLVIDMLVAIATTKIPILLQRGFWAMAHEARTDLAMLLGAGFLVIAGAGPWSLDAKLVRSLPTRAGDDGGAAGGRAPPP
jgi:putative oxidoreductase